MDGATAVEVRAVDVDEVRRLAVEYATEKAGGWMPVGLTKGALVTMLLNCAPVGTTFFLLGWCGYSTPLDTEVGGVVITQTRDGKITAGFKKVGQYVRLAGEGTEGRATHRMLVFLHPEDSR
jgi:hypothetical protein